VRQFASIRALEGRKLSEIAKDLSVELGKHPSTRGDLVGNINPVFEFDENLTWPDRYRWVACYVVGGSEGRWVHVDVLRYDKDARQWVVTRLFQGKTFEGNAYAYRVACALSELLDS
jgi:hypothetical protein